MFILKIKFIFFFILDIYLITSNVGEPSFSYDMEFARTFKLNNGYFIIAGTNGINIYDETGTISLNNITITNEQDKIKKIEDAYLTTFAQYEKGEEYVIIIVRNIIYILDSHGKFKTCFRLTHDTDNIKFYTLVPYLYGDNNYTFILGFINNVKKATLQYYSINTENKNITLLNDYRFDEDDESMKYTNYEAGISCQIMDHNIKGNLLVCFYVNYNNPEKVYSISFTLENNRIEKIPNFNASYYDKSFLIQSVITPDKKKSLVCYINDDNTRNGYCSVYNIDENRFEKYNKYLSKRCETTLEHITLNYFKETKEFFFFLHRFILSTNKFC